MKVYITKQVHHNYRYLLNWQNPDTGALMGDWFHTMKELLEYIQNWNATIVTVN